MIPRDYITEWRQSAPWVDDAQIEQDLVISRALVELFSNPTIAKALAFRGGTALYKLHVTPALRYSEDIDLVQVRAESAGPLMDALHGVLDPWLGAPRWKQTEGRVTFVYRFSSEATPPLPMRLKVEINTREHFAVHGFIEHEFAVASRWFSGRCHKRSCRRKQQKNCSPMPTRSSRAKKRSAARRKLIATLRSRSLKRSAKSSARPALSPPLHHQPSPPDTFVWALSFSQAMSRSILRHFRQTEMQPCQLGSLSERSAITSTAICSSWSSAGW